MPAPAGAAETPQAPQLPACVLVEGRGVAAKHAVPVQDVRVQQLFSQGRRPNKIKERKPDKWEREA
jgi:hypothetical protein